MHLAGRETVHQFMDLLFLLCLIARRATSLAYGYSTAVDDYLKRKQLKNGILEGSR